MTYAVFAEELGGVSSLRQTRLTHPQSRLQLGASLLESARQVSVGLRDPPPLQRLLHQGLRRSTRLSLSRTAQPRRATFKSLTGGLEFRHVSSATLIV